MRNPQFPVYVPSKGRADSRLTVKCLQNSRIPFFVIVEQAQYDTYAAVIDRSHLLVLPQRYLDEYDTCDTLGSSKSKGPGAARNFAWDHAVEHGHAWHWVMDDNIRAFWRLAQNLRIQVRAGVALAAMEDFTLRYRNVAMAGPNYNFFAKRKQLIPPFITNTRIYSCNLIRNDLAYRWRGRYNEDTDLSLRMLKDGWCTIQFNAFLQGKVKTQSLTGGNTTEFYAKEGTLAKSRMQVALHPDVSRLVQKFGRWHHHVDYRGFRNQRLLYREGYVPPAGSDEYGMTLRVAR